jgi:hypothetical protein
VPSSSKTVSVSPWSSRCHSQPAHASADDADADLDVARFRSDGDDVLDHHLTGQAIGQLANRNEIPDLLESSPLPAVAQPVADAPAPQPY